MPPDEIRDKQPGSSVIKTIAGIAGTLVAFHYGTRLVEGLGVRAGMGIVKGLEQVLKGTAQTTWKGAAEAVAGAMPSTMAFGTRVTYGRGLSLGLGVGSAYRIPVTGSRLFATIGQLPAVRSAVSPFTPLINRSIGSYSQFREFSKRIASSPFAKRMPAEALLHTTTRFFRGTEAAQRMAGAAFQYARGLPFSVASFYAVDKFLGLGRKVIFKEKPEERQPPKPWYDIGGHLASAAKFAGEFIATDLPFKAIGPLWQLGKAQAEIGLKNLVRKNQWIEKAFSRGVELANRFEPSISSVAGGISGAFEEYNTRPGSIFKIFKEHDAFLSGWKQGFENAKQEARIRQRDLALRIDSSTNAKFRILGSIGFGKDPRTLQGDPHEFFKSLFKDELDETPGFWGRVLGWKKVKYTDQAIDNAITQLKTAKEFNEGWRNDQIEGLSAIYKKLHLRKHVYRTREGLIADTRRIRPGFLLGEVYKFAVKNLNIAGFRPGRIFLLEQHLQHPETYRFGKDESFYIGRNSLLNGEPRLNLSDTEAKYNKVSGGYYTPQESAVFANGRLFAVRSDPQTPEKIMEEVAPGMAFRLFQRGSGGDITTNIIRSATGHVTSLKDIEELRNNGQMGAVRAFLHEMVFRPLEMFAGWRSQNSLFSTASNFFNKFLDPDWARNLFPKNKLVVNASKLSHPQPSSFTTEAWSRLSPEDRIGRVVAARDVIHETRNDIFQVIRKKEIRDQLLENNIIDKIFTTDREAMEYAAQLYRTGGEGATNSIAWEHLNNNDKVRRALHQFGFSHDLEFLKHISSRGAAHNWLAPSEITVVDEVRKELLFGKLAEKYSSTTGVGNKLTELADELFKNGKIGARERDLMRVIPTHLQVEQEIRNVFPKKHNWWTSGDEVSKAGFATKEGAELADRLGNLFIQNHDNLSNFANRITSVWSIPNRNPMLDAGSFRGAPEKNAPYISVPTKVPGQGLESILTGLFESKQTVQKKIASGEFIMDWPNLIAAHSYRRVAKLAEWLGFEVDPSSNRTFGEILKNTAVKRILPAMGLYYAWQMGDAFTDTSPIFQGTFLNQGLNSAVASMYSTARTTAAGVYDILGLTNTAKYLEGLAPGLVESPLMKILRGAAPIVGGAILGNKIAGNAGAFYGSIGGTLTSALGGFGLFDLTKSKDELEDIFSGRKEVPIRKGRWWPFGKTPWQGGRISYFRPHRIAVTRAQPLMTPVMYGSKEEYLSYNLNPMARLLDPYKNEREQYLRRPYPLTSSTFYGVPLVGPILSATAGQLVKPQRYMHKTELQTYFVSPGINSSYQNAPLPPGNLVTATETPDPIVPGTSLARSPEAKKPTDISSVINETIYRMGTEYMGLYGFLGDSLISSAGLYDPFYATSQMASFDRVSSINRRFWDMQLGDPGMTEYFRRFQPRVRSEIDFVNPLRNMMPDWLPGGSENTYFVDYRTGDPYGKILEGEIRLPGPGYEALKDVNLSFPGRSSMIGKTPSDMAKYFLGLNPTADDDMEEILETGTTMHRWVQSILEQRNMLVTAELPVFDPYHDVSGHIDAIVRDADNSKYILEIKTINEKGFRELSGPKQTHMGQIQFYMAATGIKRGSLLYINRDNPQFTETFNVTFNPKIHRSNLRDLEAGRQIARTMLATGEVESTWGAGYSRLDRLDILGDVCVHPSELLITDHGVIQAGNVQKGDKLKSHTGKFQGVENIFYPGILPCLSIRIYGTNIPHIVSDEHPFLCAKYEKNDYRKQGRKKGIIRYKKIWETDNGKRSAARRKIKNNDFNTLEWVQARDLTKDTYVAYPLIQKKEPIIEIELNEPNKKYTERGDGWIHPSTKGSNIYRTKKIEIDEEFCYFLGLFTAEGCVSENKIEFVLSIDETHLVNIIKNYIKKLSEYSVHSTENKNTNSIKVTFSFEGLGSFLSKQIGISALNKKIPPFMFDLDWKYQAAFLRGLFDGDGYWENKKHQAIELTTGSINLAVGVWDMFLQNKIPATLEKKKRSCGYKSSASVYYSVTVTGYEISHIYPERGCQIEKRLRKIHFNNNYAFFKIRKKEKIDDQYVINFKISTDNSFCILGAATHNCPYSDQWKEEQTNVLAMKKMGILTEEEDKRFQEIKKRRQAIVRQKDFYPKRFTPYQIINPDRKAQILSENENIKAAAEYTLPERALGGLWEYISHGHSALHTKLLNYRTPVEDYERTQLYGSQSAFWNHPFRDFVSPYVTSMSSLTSPVQGFFSAATGAGVFLGPGYALMGGALGSIMGAVGGLTQHLTDKKWIPKKVRDQRKLNEYFDKIEYEKYKRLYDITGDDDYLQKTNETMLGVNPFGIDREGWTSIYRAMPYQETPFVSAFIRTPPGPERDKIRASVPDGVRQILEAKWAQMDNRNAPNEMYLTDAEKAGELTRYFKSHYLPARDWTGWNPDTPMEDIKMQTMEREGMDAHSAGLGWASQRRRLANSPYTPGAIDMYAHGDRYRPAITTDPAKIKSIVQRVCSAFKVRATINVTDTVSPSVANVTINISYTRPEMHAIDIPGQY